MKPWKAALMVCGAMAAIGFGINITEDNYENKSTTVQEEPEKASPAPKENVFSPDEYRDFLQDELGSEVTYIPEEKAFVIFEDDPQLAEEIAATYAGLIPAESWNEFVDTFVKVSTQTEESLGASGYVMYYCNPTDRKLYLVGVMDGVLLFDYITGYNVDTEEDL